MARYLDGVGHTEIADFDADPFKVTYVPRPGGQPAADRSDGRVSWRSSAPRGRRLSRSAARGRDVAVRGSAAVPVEQHPHAVVLQLVGKRVLKLNDTIEQWLPGVFPNGDGITIRQLLNHTSGIYDYVTGRPGLRSVSRR